MNPIQNLRQVSSLATSSVTCTITPTHSAEGLLQGVARDEVLDFRSNECGTLTRLDVQELQDLARVACTGGRECGSILSNVTGPKGGR